MSEKTKQENTDIVENLVEWFKNQNIVTKITEDYGEWFGKQNIVTKFIFGGLAIAMVYIAVVSVFEIVRPPERVNLRSVCVERYSQSFIIRGERAPRREINALCSCVNNFARRNRVQINFEWEAQRTIGNANRYVCREYLLTVAALDLEAATDRINRERIRMGLEPF